MNIDITNYLRINPVDMALVCISTLIICLVAIQIPPVAIT